MKKHSDLHPGTLSQTHTHTPTPLPPTHTHEISELTGREKSLKLQDGREESYDLQSSKNQTGLILHQLES